MRTGSSQAQCRPQIEFPINFYDNFCSEGGKKKGGGGVDNGCIRYNDGINSPYLAVASLDRLLTVRKHFQHVRQMSEVLIPSFSRFSKTPFSATVLK
jgi:hypothetical protein